MPGSVYAADSKTAGVYSSPIQYPRHFGYSLTRLMTHGFDFLAAQGFLVCTAALGGAHNANPSALVRCPALNDSKIFCCLGGLLLNETHNRSCVALRVASHDEDCQG